MCKVRPRSAANETRLVRDRTGATTLVKEGSSQQVGGRRGYDGVGFVGHDRLPARAISATHLASSEPVASVGEQA